MLNRFIFDIYLCQTLIIVFLRLQCVAVAECHRVVIAWATQAQHELERIFYCMTGGFTEMKVDPAAKIMQRGAMCSLCFWRRCIYTLQPIISVPFKVPQNF